MEPGTYEELGAQARETTKSKIEAAKAAHGLGSHARYEVDLKKATIRFLDAEGAEKVRAKIQAAGSWSPTSSTWLWAWDNDSLPKKVWSKLTKVRELGEQHEIEQLYCSSDRCDEEQAWTVASIATHVLDAACLYRAPGKTSQVFLLLFDIRAK